MSNVPTTPETGPANGGPRPPHPWDVLTQLAAAGDLSGLAEAILNAPRDQVSPGEAYDLLRETLQRLSKDQDPASFSDQLFRAMVPFTAFMVMRLQHLALPTVGPGPGWSPCPPEEFVSTLFPLVRQAELHLVEMLAAWASSTRVWKLAHSSGKAKDRGRGKRRKQGNGPPPKPRLDNLWRSESDN